MSLDVLEDMHSNFGEARGSRGRAINFNENFYAGMNVCTWMTWK